MRVTQKIKDGYTQLTVFEKIIAVNVIIFILYKLFTLPGSAMSFTTFFEHFTLPSNFTAFIQQPWGIVTYAFVHFDFLHLLFNMLWLFVIGRFFSNVFHYRMGLNLFFTGILAGGILFLLAYNLFSAEMLNPTKLVGASAGVRALLIFLCAYMPLMEVRFFTFNIKLWHIGAFVVLMDVLGLFSVNVGGNLAHLGGSLLGYMYALQIKKGKPGKAINNSFTSLEKLLKRTPKSKLKTVHKRGKKMAGYTKEEFQEFTTQKRVDLILDKISKSGYESLTKEEKEFLFKAGK